MEKLSTDAEKIMIERFGKDNIIALATTVDNKPYVRSVNSFYDKGSFYVLTYGRSNKMKQIQQNPLVAIAGDWFTANGKGINLGYFGKKENLDIAEKMKVAFSEWINNGHNNFEDENTCILQIELTDGVLFSHGTRYDIDFTEQRYNFQFSNDDFIKKSTTKISKAKTGKNNAELTTKYKIGDSVMVYPEKKIGIVCAD